MSQTVDIPTIGPREWIAWLFGRRIRYEVEGHSMEPILHSGQRVLVRKTKHVTPGSIIMLRHPESEQLLIKVAETVDAVRVQVYGLNRTHSEDSRSFGPVPLERVVGEVVALFAN